MTKKNGHDKILLAHSGGGQLSEQLILGTILGRLRNDTLAQLAAGICEEFKIENTF